MNDYNQNSQNEQNPVSHSLYPNTFQHPNLYVDKLAYFLTPQENTVLAKATREILGWQHDETHTKRIALSVFIDGKFKRGAARTEENRLCYGCGLGRDAVIKALDGLDTFGVLVKSGPPTNPKGQEYTLQFEPDKIDWERLTQRKGETKALNVKRTEKARSQNPKNETTDLSDKASTVAQTSKKASTVAQTSTSTVRQTSNSSVPQTKRNSSKKPIETHHHHAETENETNIEPEQAQNDDDGGKTNFKNLVFSGLTDLNLDPPGQQSIWRKRKNYPLKLLEEVRYMIDWKNNGGEKPAGFRKPLEAYIVYCLQNGFAPDEDENKQRYRPPRDLEGDKLAAYRQKLKEEAEAL